MRRMIIPLVMETVKQSIAIASVTTTFNLVGSKQRLSSLLKLSFIIRPPKMNAWRIGINKPVDFLNPNPHAFTKGATVISKAPWVSSDIFFERWNTCTKKLSTSVFSLWFTRVITEFGLKGERELSTFFSSVSISSFRLSSDW